MSPTRRQFVLAASATAIFAAPGLSRAAGDGRTLTILHTNDRHGRYTDFEVAPGNALAQTGNQGDHEFSRAGRIGGFGTLATLIKQRRAELGAQNVLLVDGGDSFSDDLLGNLTEGATVIEMMNFLDYDFMALGNHDFDYGYARTKSLAEKAKFPMRGANIVDDASGGPALGDPTLVREVGGVKVGLLALGYHNTNKTGSKDNLKGLTFGNGIEVARTLVPQLRKEAELVVVVSHQGSAVDRELLARVPGIDLVIGAHSHDLISPPERVGGGWLVQALSDGAMLGEVRIHFSQGRPARVDGTVYPLWQDLYTPDRQAEDKIAALRAPHKDKLEEVLAEADERIGRSYKVESPFDKLAARIVRETTGTVAAFLPGVGYGVALQKGPVTRENLRTLLPHPAKLATLEVTGAQILAVLEQSATNLKPGDPMQIVGGLIQTDGMAWTANFSKPVGERISAVTIGGQELDAAKSYRVTVNAAMLNGLHNYGVFGQGKKIEKLETDLPQMVEDAFRRDGRIKRPQMGDINLVGSDK